MFAGFNRSSTARPSSSKNTLRQDDPFDTQISPLETIPGDFWTIERGGEDWPVVICDEDLVETYFKRKCKPENARQANGKWGKAYGPGGLDEEKKCFPAVFLGTWQLTWAPAKRLEHIDDHLAKAIQKTTTNATLDQAWRDYSGHCTDDNPLNYCKQRLRQQQLGKAPSSVSKTPTFKMPGKRKRTGMAFKYPPGYTKEEVDEEESDNLFLRPGAEPKIKNEFSDSSSSAEIDALYDDPDPPIPVRGGQQSKRSKADTTGRFSTRPNTPGGNSGISMAGSPSAAARKARAASKFPAKKNTDPDRVIIYVGNPHTQYGAKRSSLDISPLLKSLIAYHPDNGWYVMSPVLSQLDPADFLPIGQYLTRREYDPNILDDGTDFVRLEGDLSDPERGVEVVRCGIIYNTAQMLELPGLQDLAFRKLKALERQEAHQAFAILTIVEMVFERADEDLRLYLVQYMAEHYWDLVLAETTKIAEVMKDNEELAQGVYGLLSGRADVDAKVEEGVKVEKEDKKVKKEKEEMNIFRDDSDLELGSAREKTATVPSALGDDFEVVGGAESNPEAHAGLSIFGDGLGNSSGEGKEQDTSASSQGIVKDDGATNKNDPSKEGLDEAEQEMIKIALRESDLEATKEDLTKLMQRQSSCFGAYSPGVRASMET